MVRKTLAALFLQPHARFFWPSQRLKRKTRATMAFWI